MDPFSVQAEQSIGSVSKLMEKYKDDPYMFAKVHNYVCFQLPNIMENIKKNYDERQQRIAGLIVEQDGFIERFLNMHRYFYVSTTDTFVVYDGLHYEIITEDSILHHILTTITCNETQLMDWKQRTKVYLMKRIKENALCKSVPESETIQYVLENIHPVLFETKEEAKYFLTILGDNILRKKHDVVHFMSPKAKVFLRELANVSLYLFGANSTATFKHKYYDHEYERCRMVKINDTIESEHIWGQILQNVSMDMLCIACHYSLRYGSSDDYVSRFSNQYTLESSVFYLKNNSQDQLVNQFITDYLQVSLNGTTTYISMSPGTTPPVVPSNLSIALSNALSNAVTTNNTSRQISWKNMQYLWSHFLSSVRLPTVMFQQDLKQKLTLKLCENYKEETDTFIGVSSRFMPYIRAFIHFWENTIEYDETGEYEMDELCMLYKKWLGTQSKTHGGYGFSNMLNEKQMLDLILYYFPNIEIEKDKYVYQIRCRMWDKQMDIQTALDQMKEHIRETNHTGAISLYATSIYDAYIWYCKYYSDMPQTPNGVFEKHPIVSKLYFEKYIMESIGIYVIDDKYLSSEWITSSM
jgi:hypothetical protein